MGMEDPLPRGLPHMTGKLMLSVGRRAQFLYTETSPWGSIELLEFPQKIVADFLQSRWSKREQGESCYVHHDSAS